ncbi:MAG: hypothetical protein KJO29_05885 [Bacteroidia bacterium]|nr:hypothetical protein [Bacteroidia bacterium]
MRKTAFYSYLFIILFSIRAQAQDMPDFMIIDSDNIEHHLYADYLDKGYTVLIKIFFVDCPPCNSIAPHVQSLYEKWGEGQYDVQFIELSNKSWDSNQDVAGYKTKHGITFPGAGEDGNALVALQPFTSGMFGSFFGTPKFAVIAPDRSVNFSIGGSGILGKIDALDAAIAATGATGMGSSTQLPSVFQLNVEDAFGEPVDEYELVLSSDDNSGSENTIILDQNASFSITDLANEYPDLSNPKISIRKTDNLKQNLSAIDLLIIVKHILGVESLTDPLLTVAADTNNDDSINAIDLITLQRIILGISNEFPGSDPYKFIPSEIPISLSPGNTQDLIFKAVKLGDLNGF